MPNAVNYNVSAQTQALKKGNFWIATGDVGKGTGYWNGITPPSNGYTIYLNKASNGPSIYTVSTEAQLTGLTSTIAGQTLTTSGACLNWFATQTDKMILNIDYPTIITDGLIVNLDAGFTPSYPTINSTWYDTSPSANNSILANSPTYSNGSIVFDGVDDYAYFTSPNSLLTPTFTVCSVVTPITVANNGTVVLTNESARLNLGIAYGGSSGAYFFVTGNNGQGINGTQASYNFSFGTNTKYFVTWIVDIPGKNFQFWVNGTQIWSSNADLGTNFNNPSTNGFVLASRYGGGASQVNIGISTFQFYNKVLSSSEILQNYLAIMNPKFIFGSNLKIWYDMSLQPSEASVDNVNTIDSSNNLVTLSRVYDLSGNGKHLLQTTKVNQPTFIPNSQNSKPANYNTGGSVYDLDATVMRTSYNALTSGARSFFIVLKGAPNSAFSWDRDSSHRGSLQLGYSSVNGWNDLQQDAAVYIGGGNGTTTYVMSYLFDTTQTLLYRNGNLNRSQSNNTYTISTGTNSPFGCWSTAPSAGNQEGYWYEMIFLNKIPTISEYNTLVTYLGTKWGVSCGTLTNYN
jgi:hypothetical protein